MMSNEYALADFLFMIKRTTLFRPRTTDKGDATDDVSTYVLKIYDKPSFCNTGEILNIDMQDLQDLLL